MTRLVVVGSGGHGVVVAEAAKANGSWTEVVFVDDDNSESKVLEFSIIGSLSELESLLDRETECVVAIGDNKIRLDIIGKLIDGSFRIASVIHPSAVVSPSARIGQGTVICAGAIVNARASIGMGCILNTGSTVDHDCVLNDGVHVSPGANLAGCVAIGQGTWVGIGASVKDGISIGDEAIVGAGAAVVSNVGARTTVAGVPARLLGAG